MTHIANILFYLCGNEFLVPYLRRELTPDFDPERPELTPDPEPSCAVRIVQESFEGNNADLEAFREACRERSLPVLTLRCPNIIGTGMTGRMRRLAESIYRGSYFHVAGGEGRTSLIHATDVARAVAVAAGSVGEYLLTDNTPHAIHDIAEALARRIDDKRIFTWPAWLCRIWYSSATYRFLTSDTCRQDTFAEAFPDFAPADTVNYLLTHVYDDASL